MVLRVMQITEGRKERSSGVSTMKFRSSCRAKNIDDRGHRNHRGKTQGLSRRFVALWTFSVYLCAPLWLKLLRPRSYTRNWNQARSVKDTEFHRGPTTEAL